MQNRLFKISASLVSLALAGMTLTGCETTSPNTSTMTTGSVGPYERTYVHVAGNPYKTLPGCKRTEPVGKFDPLCDEPVLGYSGFVDPSTIVQAGGTGTFGL